MVKRASGILIFLKYILYKLNHEFNPEKAKEIRETSVTLANAERIRNGEEPLFDTELTEGKEE